MRGQGVRASRGRAVDSRGISRSDLDGGARRPGGPWLRWQGRGGACDGWEGREPRPPDAGMEKRRGTKIKINKVSEAGGRVAATQRHAYSHHISTSGPWRSLPVSDCATSGPWRSLPACDSATSGPWRSLPVSDSATSGPQRSIPDSDSPTSAVRAAAGVRAAPGDGVLAPIGDAATLTPPFGLAN